MLILLMSFIFVATFCTACAIIKINDNVAFYSFGFVAVMAAVAFLVLLITTSTQDGNALKEAEKTQRAEVVKALTKAKVSAEELNQVENLSASIKKYPALDGAQFNFNADGTIGKVTFTKSMEVKTQTGGSCSLVSATGQVLTGSDFNKPTVTTTRDKSCK